MSYPPEPIVTVLPERAMPSRRPQLLDCGFARDVVVLPCGGVPRSSDARFRQRSRSHLATTRTRSVLAESLWTAVQSGRSTVGSEATLRRRGSASPQMHGIIAMPAPAAAAA